LRTLNTTQSAYACLTFDGASFFDEFKVASPSEVMLSANQHAVANNINNNNSNATSVGGSVAPSASAVNSNQNDDGRNQSSLKWKLNLKNCMNAFRSIAPIDKLILKALGTSRNVSTFQFQFQYKSGITKTFSFTMEEQPNILQADFARETCRNVVVCPAKLIHDCVNNFHSSMDEISLTFLSRNMKVKSYVDEESDIGQTVVQTCYNIDVADLVSYSVRSINNNDINITFCLKEFKAILQLCYSLNDNLHIFFQQGGSPVLVSNVDSNRGSFIADVVIATLQEDEQQANHPSQAQAQAQAQASA
jgi:hypothetical protein